MPKRSRNGEQKIDQLNRAIEAILVRPDAKPVKVDPGLAPLLRIAGELRGLPGENFKERLKADLERSISMATATKPIAAVRTFAAPRLTFKSGAKAIEFYKNAFGAREIMRFENEGGMGHAEVMIGDSVIMFAEEWPEGGRFSAETTGSSPISMVIQVPDVDAFAEHAVSAGAVLTRPIADQFYGYRDAILLDPFGYTWAVHTIREEMSVEEMHRRFNAMMKREPKEMEKPSVSPIPKGYRMVTPYLVAQDADDLIEFVEKTFDAEETFRSGPGSEGGMHAEVRLGDSMLMIGGGGSGLNWRGTPKLGAFHVYVRDCDEVYERALQAGATSIQGPADQEYGERTANVRDPAGNYWYIATFKGANYKWEGAPDMQPYLHPLRAEPVINFLKRAFGARETGRYTAPDGVMHHTTIKIGDSYMEMGEAQGPYQPMPAMFYLYVPDCDSVYQRALAAGATSISGPTDQPYGDRSGAVKDAFGNQWYIATHIKDVEM